VITSARSRAPPPARAWCILRHQDRRLAASSGRQAQRPARGFPTSTRARGAARQRCDLVVGAAKLERSAPLKALGLEGHACACQLVERARAHDGRSVSDAVENARGGANSSARDQLGHCRRRQPFTAQLSQSCTRVRSPEQGLQSRHDAGGLPERGKSQRRGTACSSTASSVGATRDRRNHAARRQGDEPSAAASRRQRARPGLWVR